MVVAGRFSSPESVPLVGVKSALAILVSLDGIDKGGETDDKRGIPRITRDKKKKNKRVGKAPFQLD